MEYLLVLVAFLSIVLAMAALWRMSQDGALVRIAKEGASHGTSGGFVGMAQDLLAY